MTWSRWKDPRLSVNTTLPYGSMLVTPPIAPYSLTAERASLPRRLLWSFLSFRCPSSVAHELSFIAWTNPGRWIVRNDFCHVSQRHDVLRFLTTLIRSTMFRPTAVPYQSCIGNTVLMNGIERPLFAEHEHDLDPPDPARTP